MLEPLRAHLRSRQVSRVVYGAIIGLAIVVSLESHPPSPGVVAGTLLGTAVAVALAELYSEILGRETQTRRHVDRAFLRATWSDVTVVAFGVAFPAVFFLLSAAGAMDVDTAFDVAKWSGLGLTGFYGFVAARFAGESLLSAVVHAAAVALIGGFLIGLKALTH
jgi:hypothetical protein